MSQSAQTGLSVNSTANGITAFATGGQASATLLTADANRVTTVGTAADSVKLPAISRLGQVVFVGNSAAANSMNLFPNTGATINNGASNAALAVAAGKSVVCVAVSATAWIAAGV